MTRRHVRLPIGRVRRALPPRGDEFVSVEALGGIVLLAGAIAALAWANAAPGSYAQAWGTQFRLGVGDTSVSLSLAGWVNDALMVLFFFVVGLEIKRELVTGELRDPRTASLPVAAALGGMVVPAVLYLALNLGGDGARGWGIPMATDIAFAVGVLAIAGSRAPRGLKLFLLTLAIVDDVGAILVIAVFYTADLHAIWLAGTAGAVIGILVLQRLGVVSVLPYVPLGVLAWYFTHESGVHATIAGVAIGLLTPAGSFRGRRVLEQLEARIHPWSSFVVVPLFALANAGVLLEGDSLRAAASSSISLGIVLGLVVGKTAGIFATVALGTRLGLGRLAPGLRLSHILAVGVLAGIGFTVSLFVAELSFTDDHLAAAKIGILAASALAGLAGAVVLTLLGRAGPRPAASPRHPI